MILLVQLLLLHFITVVVIVRLRDLIKTQEKANRVPRRWKRRGPGSAVADRPKVDHHRVLIRTLLDFLRENNENDYEKVAKCLLTEVDKAQPPSEFGTTTTALKFESVKRST